MGPELPRAPDDRLGAEAGTSADVALAICRHDDRSLGRCGLPLTQTLQTYRHKTRALATESTRINPNGICLLRDPNRKNHYSRNDYKKMRQMSEQARDKNA